MRDKRTESVEPEYTGSANVGHPILECTTNEKSELLYGSDIRQREWPGKQKKFTELYARRTREDSV